jgi:hypothetical protein
VGLRDQRVDDAAEQPGFDQQNAGQTQIGRGQQARQPLLGREQRDHPQIDLQHGHGWGNPPVRRP